MYPLSPLPARNLTALDAARDSTVSFQVCFHAKVYAKLALTAEAEGGLGVRVRRVGFVPMPHFNTPGTDAAEDREGIGFVPGLVPDPLFDDSTLVVGAGETGSYWITVSVPKTVQPGEYAISLKATWDACDWKSVPGTPVSRKITIRVHHVVLQPRRDFPVSQCFYVDALFDRYGTDFSQPRFWELAEAYLRDVVAHGQNSASVPVFTLPMDGVKRPSQLLHVSREPDGTWRFDWSLVRRYVRLARECGLEYCDWPHFFTQWGARYAIRIYEGHGETETLVFPADTPATSDVYRGFLRAFFPEFHRFLTEEKILQKSLFHVSDEPSGPEGLAAYRAAREMLRELAPWMRVMDATSDMAFAAQKDLTDAPIPNVDLALDFLKAGLSQSWCYYCCIPRSRYINRLLDTPAAKILMHGFLFYRWPFHGFLHWGYNYWYKSQTRQMIDPFTTSDGLAWPGWPHGDTFCVYPGENGPIDSIRWELFGEALQDYRLLQTLGVSRDDPMLADIRSFEDFPKNADWRDRVRLALLSRG